FAGLRTRWAMRYLLLFLLAPSLSFAAEPPLAIRNATVETVAAAGRVENATIVIRDGKIAAIGKDVAIPADATLMDAEGGTLIPGLSDPYLEFTVAAAPQDAGPRTAVPGRGRGFQFQGMGQRAGGAFTRVADNFYPHDPGFKPLPRVGLTRLNLVTN